jgi:micrococcal nuclease
LFNHKHINMNKKSTKKSNNLLSQIVGFIILVIVGFFSLVSQNDAPVSNSIAGTVRPSQEATVAGTTAVAYPTMPTTVRPAVLVRVIDGDTVLVEMNGRDQRVRLVGMNTPESVAENRPVECFGKEAAKRANELLSEGETVYLEIDETQDSKDQYGRLLRYLWFADGRLYNMQMIAEGFSYEYTYDRGSPPKYQAEFRAAQADAAANKIGLWSSSTCDGQR